MSNRLFRALTVAVVAAYWSIGLAFALTGGLMGVVVCVAIDRALGSIVRDAERALGDTP